MAVREILLLGNPKLYSSCEAVQKGDPELPSIITDLHDTMMAFRKKWSVGRAIAAPQIGVMKRLVYLHINEPVVFINPHFEKKSDALIEVWDDCMSFPELLIKVNRHVACDLVYYDLNWREQRLKLNGDWSELLQHEVDHLDGVLAVSLAVDSRSFVLRSQQRFTSYHRSGFGEG